ncbi:MAG: N(G),N(G)-dimethylarginine dimethylaminohydrolase [Gemmatimonadales bacterium]|nr:N(G),N(G)-dimethylarginine dimethylaminohydrolase [Gemmatimonadales bacterium]
MTDGTTFTRAIVCPPADSYATGLTTARLGPPDLARARAQHVAYVAALEAAGVQVTTLPSHSDHPDGTFVEDTSIVTAKGAILCRPGAPTRAGEVVAMRAALELLLGEELDAIVEPGTVDGGDICQAGSHFFIGLSQRTNEAGADQLARWLDRLGYTSSTVTIRDDPTLLHLKSGLVWLGDQQLLAVPSLAAHPALSAYDVLTVPLDELYAANCVRVNDVLLVSAGYPRITATLAAMGYQVVPLEMSEFQKMDGGLSCLSIRVP